MSGMHAVTWVDLFHRTQLVRMHCVYELYVLYVVCSKNGCILLVQYNLIICMHAPVHPHVSSQSRLLH